LTNLEKAYLIYLFISQHSTGYLVSIDGLIHDQWTKRSCSIWGTIRSLPGVTELNHLILGRIAVFVLRFDTVMSRTRHKALPSGRTVRCVFIQWLFQPQKILNCKNDRK